MIDDADLLAAAIAALRPAYPRQDFPNDSVAMYARMLGDFDSTEVGEAIKRIVRRSEWLPSIAEIRREVVEARLQLPSAAEAWSMVLNVATVNWLDVPEIVRDSITVFGGRQAILQSEKATWTRAQFLRDYADRRAATVEEAAGASPRPTLTEGEGRRTLDA